MVCLRVGGEGDFCEVGEEGVSFCCAGLGAGGWCVPLMRPSTTALQVKSGACCPTRTLPWALIVGSSEVIKSIIVSRREDLPQE